MKQDLVLENIVFDVDTKKPIPIDLNQIVKGRALFQANSGGGKSFLLRKFLESSHGLVQQIIIDPEGEFPTLRELPDNDYLLVSKDASADIVLDVRHAPLLAKKLMETGANAIIDLYELNPFERIRYVKVFLDALVNLPKKLWHPCLVIIDEIHVFAPEASKSDSLDSVASLASRGRKRGYALIGATQKLSKFHKDVASELNTKFTGRCTLDIDQKRAAAELGIKNYQSLRDLEFEFYVYGPSIPGGTIKVKSYPVKTTHEDIGSETVFQVANPNKIKKLMQNFQELPQEAENEMKTLDDHKRKIQELQKSLNEIRSVKTIDPESLKKAQDLGYERGYSDSRKEALKVIESYKKYIFATKQSTSKIKDSIKEFISKSDKEFDLILITSPILTELPVQTNPVSLIQTYQQVLSKPIPPTTRVGFRNEDASFLNSGGKPVDRKPLQDGEKLGRCEESILKALIQRGKKSSKIQVAVISGYSSNSGGFNNAISKLKSLQFIQISNGDLEITDAGTEYIGDFERIPDDHESLLRFWTNKLGKCPASILIYLCKEKDSWHNKIEIGENTGYSANSGGFNNGLSQVCSLGLVERGNGGMFKASMELFPYG